MTNLRFSSRFGVMASYAIVSVSLVFAGSSTVGCATAKILARNPSADHGPVPTNSEQQIRSFWQTTLKDPGSVQVIKMGKPEKAFAYSATEKPHGYDYYADVTFEPVYGHRVCVTFNAKNAYGGYAGATTATYFFEKGGRMSAPLPMSDSMMNAMHRTGSFGNETRVITEWCQ